MQDKRKRLDCLHPQAVSYLQQAGPACRREALWPPPPAWWWRSCTRHQPGSRGAPAAHTSGSLEPSTAALKYIATCVLLVTTQTTALAGNRLLCSLTICRRFGVGKPLSLQNFVVAVVCDLQDKAAIHHTVSWLQTSVTHPVVMEVLHTLSKQFVLFCTFWYFGSTAIGKTQMVPPSNADSP